MDAALDDITARIRSAARSRTPLRIQGGGSKAFYGEPGARGEPLSTQGLQGIVSYEPTELVVTARGGTPLAQLEQELAANGQCLPFEPPYFGGSPTVGGMVAAGLAGPARASVGGVRDFVLGATIVNGRGEVLVFGGQVMKNVAGYDVSRLMAGSLGTLGLIAQVSLKVLPIAPAEATLRFELPQQEALERLNTWGGLPLPLNASAWTDDGGIPRLDVRLRGAAAAVEAACRQMGGERVADAAPHWRARRDLALERFAARGACDLWRLSVPQTAPALNLPDSPCVEWHGAQRWVRADRADAAAVRRTAQAVGGSATLFMPGMQAAADAPSVSRFDPLPPALARIHRELKQAFDPEGILNPGRLAAGL